MTASSREPPRDLFGHLPPEEQDEARARVKRYFELVLQVTDHKLDLTDDDGPPTVDSTV